MSEIEDKLASYVHPDYWDGHSIGYGEVMPPQRPLLDLSLGKQAEQLLGDFLVRAQQRFPLETYVDGQTFAPGAYDPGTITCLKDERLISAPGLRIDFSDMDETEPARPDPRIQGGVPTAMGPFDIILGLGRNELLYSNLVSWGVVVSGRGKKPPVLATIPASLVRRAGPAIAFLTQFTIFTDPIEIGKTYHYGDQSIRPVESLRRVLSLEVCDYGTPRTARQPRFGTGWLGRLAPGEV